MITFHLFCTVLMTQAPSEADVSAIETIRAGDPNAFRHFISTYKNSVECLLSRHVSRDMVAELAQETFIRAYGSLDSYDKSRPFDKWVLTIALRCCYEYLRKRYANRETPISTLSSDCLDWLERKTATNALAAYRDKEDTRDALELLDWALGQLAPKDRIVLLLLYGDGYSMLEVAEMLDMSSVNVRVRAFRARKKVHKLLAGVL